MKNLKIQYGLIVILVIGSMFCVSFIGKKALQASKANASVTIKENIGVFAFSVPIQKYDILGSVHLPGLVGSERSDKCLETLIKRAKKDFPSVEALIVNTEFSKAECIRFKE